MKALAIVVVLLSLLGNTFAGKGPCVPEPWTPVTVREDAAGICVGVWGRNHTFSKAALPTSITAGGEELLAAPIRLKGAVDGKPISWRPGGNMVLRSGSEQATVSSWQSSDDVTVNTSTLIEFDGMLRVNLAVVPQYRKKPKLDQLWLEIPLKRTLSSLYHYYPGRWGKAANSGGLSDKGMVLPFKPFLWIGDEARGLGWFAESDQGWQPQSTERVIEVLPGEEEVLLRIRLLDSEVKLPFSITFGLQATPVKPWMKDFHEQRIWHASELGVGVTMPVPKKWWLCHRAFPDRKPIPKLDKAKELGVKTVVFHEDWVPIQNYPVTTPESDFKDIVDACHDRGMKVLVYQGYELSPLAPEWGELHDEVLTKDRNGNYITYWYRPPDQRDYKVCYNSVWADLLAGHISRAMSRYNIDGLYLDSTMSPAACCNEAHGCGYRTADGKLHPTYPIFGVRRFLKRLYSMVHARGGIISAHQSTCCATPTLAFVDAYWDGEQLTSGGDADDPLKELSLDTFKAEFMGHNFGVPCEFLAYERPPHWTFDHALAVSMLHDVRVRPCGLATLEKMSPIWNAMTCFDVTESEWHPYWETQSHVTSQSDSVKVSYYQQSASRWKKGRMLLVVSNLSPDKPVNAAVTLDAAGLGIKVTKVSDALSGEKISFDGKQLIVPLEAMRMRMMLVE